MSLYSQLANAHSAFYGKMHNLIQVLELPSQVREAVTDICGAMNAHYERLNVYDCAVVGAAAGAERFIRGFEDDEQQEGIEAILEPLRALIAGHEPQYHAVKILEGWLDAAGRLADGSIIGDLDEDAVLAIAEKTAAFLHVQGPVVESPSAEITAPEQRAIVVMRGGTVEEVLGVDNWRVWDWNDIEDDIESMPDLAGFEDLIAGYDIEAEWKKAQPVELLPFTLVVAYPTDTPDRLRHEIVHVEATASDLAFGGWFAAQPAPRPDVTRIATFAGHLTAV